MLDYNRFVREPKGLTFFYWDHARESDRLQLLDVAKEFAESTIEDFDSWRLHFDAEWSFLYSPRVEKLSKVHLVVRQATGGITAKDRAVAHIAIAFVTKDFIQTVCEYKGEDRVWLYMNDHRARPAVISKNQLISNQQDKGSDLWLVYLHLNASDDLDTVLITEQLQLAIRTELRRYNINRIFMEAALDKRSVKAFGLSPVSKPDLKLLVGEARKQALSDGTRTLFYSDKDIASSMPPERPAFILFHYRKPEVFLSAASKRAVILWYRFGKDCRRARSMLRDFGRSHQVSQRHLSEEVANAMEVLGLQKGDFHALEKVVECHPGLFGPYKDE